MDIPESINPPVIVRPPTLCDLPPTLGFFFEILQKGKIYDGLFQTNMPFFERIIQIYNGLFFVTCRVGNNQYYNIDGFQK